MNPPEGFNAVVEALARTMNEAISDMLDRSERQTTVHLPPRVAIRMETRTQATASRSERSREWLYAELLINEGGRMTPAVGIGLQMPPSRTEEHRAAAPDEGSDEGEHDGEDSEDDEAYTEFPWNDGQYALTVDSAARVFLYNLMESHGATQEEQEYMLRDIAAVVGMERHEVEAIAFAPS